MEVSHDTRKGLPSGVSIDLTTSTIIKFFHKHQFKVLVEISKTLSVCSATSVQRISIHIKSGKSKHGQTWKPMQLVKTAVQKTIKRYFK